MQKAIILNRPANFASSNNDRETSFTELQKLLVSGWKVAQTCSYQEPVAVATGLMTKEVICGNYGILIILEKEDTKY